MSGATDRARFAATVLAPFALVASAGACDAGSDAPTSSAVAFEGARVIVGDGSVIEGAVFVVDGDRLTQVGAAGEVEAPEGAARVDLSGKTVMPAIVNAHFHLNPERAARTEQLQHSAYYGTALAVSLGLDEGEASFQMRDEVLADGARSQTAGRGITSPEPGRSEVPHWVTTEEEARAAVRELAAQQVDIVKIWVDDRGGQYERLSPELYGAVIDEAHAHGLRVTAHVFRLEDAKGLLRAGVDAFAHGIRDMDIDDELVELWRERAHVVLVPNLPGPGVAETFDWLSGTVSAERIAEMNEGSTDRPQAQEFFGIQARNMMRLHGEGFPVSFGTDGGSPWAVHQELADMVRAGMSPADVIVAATSTSAEFVGAGALGTIAAGKSADFMVLDANPLDDITNTRAISAVYLRGVALDREGMGERFRAADSG
ncbi:MAG: amidohydrolase family protein [Gemmatimonadota bacterium]|nr:amidohydrolase family protein [Gemmatimonadota bacterium]MDE2866293.1 amidohydrolase family protein [Gemmatimonadota bacterium]